LSNESVSEEVREEVNEAISEEVSDEVNEAISEEVREEVNENSFKPAEQATVGQRFTSSFAKDEIKPKEIKFSYFKKSKKPLNATFRARVKSQNFTKKVYSM